MMQTEDSKKLYSPNIAARVLDVSRSKIYDLMKSGRLHYVTIDSDRKIPASEIDRLTREGTEPEQAAA
jgi:excisionase family DNA binding protein